MANTPYKTPKNVKEQLLILESRGLVINNKDEAKAFLINKNYYRFRAYSIIFEKEKDKFFDNTTFDDIKILYDFDRELRSICSLALASIEVALRTRLAYHFALQTNDPLAHENNENFAMTHNKRYSTIDEFRAEQIYNPIEKSHERFITHYRNNYSAMFPKIPIWAMVEVITFNTLSSLYKFMKPRFQKQIAKSFGFNNSKILASWLHSCVLVRNMCAHNATLWNRNIANIPAIGNNTVKFAKNKIGLACLLIYQLLHSIDYREAETFKNHIFDLIDKYEKNLPTQINFLEQMGLITDWKKHFNLLSDI